MKYFLITGSAGLIGSECSEFFIKKGFKVLGLDNNSRKRFFGHSGSINVRKNQLNEMNDYLHFNVDIRNKKKVEEIFIEFNKKINCIIHCAAQPSHDYGKNYPIIDFNVNGESGRYTNYLCVYGKAGEPRLKCDDTIKKLKVAGRGTYVCIKCQKKYS